MSRLTVKQLESLTSQDINRKLFDGNGLYGRVRLQKTGIVVSFEYRFKQQHKARAVSCGKWPVDSLRDIRKNRDDKMTLVEQGIDPIEQKRAEKLCKKVELIQTIKNKQIELAEITKRRTLNDAVKDWHRLELIRRKDGGSEAMRGLQKDILPLLGNVALADINRSMLMDILYKVVERGARSMANHLFADLRQFYNFAVVREWVNAHPLVGLNRDKIGGREKERDRCLTEDEVVELTQRLPKAGLLPTTEIAIWIMLSTCCRVGELSQACWEDVNLEKATWLIPASNSKNARDHTIFLSEFAKKYFAKLRSITGKTNWCLPSRKKDRAIYPESIAKQIRDRIREQALVNRVKATGILLLSGGAWTPHDLRRTGATMMGELGILGDIIERCLNHVEQNKLKRIYQRHELKDEQRHAWEILGDKLETLVNSANGTYENSVVPHNSC